MDNLCPIDGRYRNQTDEIRERGFTEKQLILTKAYVELKWLCHLIKIFNRNKEFPELELPEIKLPEMDHDWPLAAKCVCSIIDELDKNPEFQQSFITRVSEIELSTKHDTKAVELAIKEALRAKQESGLEFLIEFTHFGLTSEDVTGAAFSLMFQRVYSDCLRPLQKRLVEQLLSLAESEREEVMLSMTHGQPASPTTFGKELCVFLNRLLIVGFTDSFFDPNAQPFTRTWTHPGQNPTIKFGGAVGGFSALREAFPFVDWLGEAAFFVESLKGRRDEPGSFHLDLCTTQIANREWMMMRLRSYELQNNILLDLAKDLWLYTSRGLLKLSRGSAQEVGSSTMPHKINPIDFENAEGNLTMANGLINILCTKLSQSRLQRDLSDSTVIRNLGLVFSYTLVALKSLLKGLQKISFDRAAAVQEVQAHPEILAEPIQTILRKYPNIVSDPYEKLKALTRRDHENESPTDLIKKLRGFVDSLESDGIDPVDLDNMHDLLNSPESYTGLAVNIANNVIEFWRKKLLDSQGDHSI